MAPEALRIDIPFMVWASLVCLPMCRTRYEIERWEGGLLVTSMIIYTVCLAQRSLSPGFEEAAVLLTVAVLVLLMALAPFCLPLRGGEEPSVDPA